MTKKIPCHIVVPFNYGWHILWQKLHCILLWYVILYILIQAPTQMRKDFAWTTLWTKHDILKYWDWQVDFVYILLSIRTDNTQDSHIKLVLKIYQCISKSGLHKWITTFSLHVSVQKWFLKMSEKYFERLIKRFIRIN